MADGKAAWRAVNLPARTEPSNRFTEFWYPRPSTHPSKERVGIHSLREATMSEKVSGTYQTGGGFVSLDVVIGNGHKGRSKILLDNVEVARGGGSVSANLGSGLAGRQVVVISTMNQTNPKSMETCVDYKFSGGPAPQTFTGTKVVSNKGQGVDYEGTFTLA